MEPTFTLARFAVGDIEAGAAGNLPSSARTEARRAFLNALGCMLGGAGDPATARLWTSLQPFAGAPGASLIGRRERTDALTAALVNGYASNILDFDDTHLATVIHPGVAVLAPVLAIAEAMPAGLPCPGGRDLLDAFLIGMEVACRLGMAIGPGHYARGWHITGTCGVVGAAAATGRLLRLDALRMTHALGIAATSACGLGEMLGGMSKSYNIARAGREGLASALLAAGGFTSSLRALEAPRGFAAVLADGLDIDALTGDLGTRWEAAKDTYKPFPCGIVLHPLIDGCLQLAQEPGFDPAQIDSVEVRVHPLVLVLTGRTAPKDGLEAKLSYTHACAVALVDRAAGVDQFDDARANDPVIVRARHLVRAAVDTALGADQAEVTIRFIDGRSRSCRIEHAIGSLDNPMTDAALASKFRALGARSLGEARTRSLLDRCLQIDTLADAGELIALARPAR